MKVMGETSLIEKLSDKEWSAKEKGDGQQNCHRHGQQYQVKQRSTGYGS
jgi:hypothetical protein